MNAIGSVTAPAAKQKGGPGEAELRRTFQKFVAGTFYKQMLKSLRKMHGKPAYFHGGQAEEIFQAQMDQQVAEDLAESRGDALAAPFYESFAQQVKSALSGKVERRDSNDESEAKSG